MHFIKADFLVKFVLQKLYYLIINQKLKSGFSFAIFAFTFANFAFKKASRKGRKESAKFAEF